MVPYGHGSQPYNGVVAVDEELDEPETSELDSSELDTSELDTSELGEEELGASDEPPIAE